MKTAVEYIYEKLMGNEYWYADITFDEIFEQAKEMEKEQIIEFAKKCIHKALESDILMAYNQVEQYYNETFKSE